MRQYKTISADGHVNEPVDLFDRMPKHLQEDGPKLVHMEGGDAWVMYPGANPRLISTSAVAGNRPEDYLKEPVTYANMRPGSFDPKARLGDMDIDDVDADVLYPGIMRYVGGIPKPEVRRAAVQGYNDWMAEFDSCEPSRLIGLALIEVEDAEFATAELERARKGGLRTVCLIQRIGGRPLHDPAMEPFWTMAEELDMPVTVHTGASALGGKAAHGPGVAEIPGTREALMAVNRLELLPDLAAIIFNGLFDRHPKLQVVAVESGIGWMPFFLNRLEYVYRNHRFHMKSPLKLHPTEYMVNNLWATFEEEDPEPVLRCGFKNLMWASDYPHTATTWPNSQKLIGEWFKHISAEERTKIVAQNAVDLYQLS